MRIVEPPLASICQDMINCIDRKDAESEYDKVLEQWKKSKETSK
jgi:hypothetical protein